MSRDDFQVTIKPEDVNKDPAVLSVSDLNSHIKELLEENLGTVWVKGEISNFKPHSSGHMYFSLKDSSSQILAVMFKGFNSRLRFRPEDGMEVVVRGRLSVYEPRGNYQIICEIMEPVGYGALQLAYEQLKKKLQAEGLFDSKRKKVLPPLPQRVALVTSPTGAAVRDMLNVLSRRFKGLDITVIPTAVQGANAPREIVAAIELANRIGNFDVMIVGRGGGSIEDLWAFNDEGVARAIAASKIPTVSAVGHEVDVTIADFVADLRAPTPSAAAELIVKNAADLNERIVMLGRQLRQHVVNQLQQHKIHLVQISKRLVDPKRKLEEYAQRCDELGERLTAATIRHVKMLSTKVQLLEGKMVRPEQVLARAKKDLEMFELRLQMSQRKLLATKQYDYSRMVAVLESMSPLKVVERGYSMVQKDGEVVKAYTQLNVGDEVYVTLAKGGFAAKVEKIDKKNKE